MTYGMSIKALWDKGEVTFVMGTVQGVGISTMIVVITALLTLSIKKYILSFLYPEGYLMTVLSVAKVVPCTDMSKMVWGYINCAKVTGIHGKVTFSYILWNINVNVYDFSLISPWVQQTSQFTPFVLELSLLSLISSGENWTFALFAAATDSHYNLAFSFHKVPTTDRWTEGSWYERLDQHLYTWPWLKHRSLIQVTGLADA